MKFTSVDAKLILAEFGVITPSVQAIDSKITKLTKLHPDQISTFYQFDFNKKTYGVLFNEAIDDNDQTAISNLTPWPDGEVKALPNPHVASGFGFPFRQKTCFLVVRNFHQLRLDLYLARLYPDFSRSQLQKFIKSHQVTVNQIIEASPKRLIDTSTDQIELKLMPTTQKAIQNLPILFENQHLLIINKPAGMLSHATHQTQDTEATVADFIKQHGTFAERDYRSGIVHRLDRATSGVMVLAKDQPTADYLKAEFKARHVHKTYYAVVTGDLEMPQAKIDLPLRRSLKNAGKFMVDASGKPAITFYQLIKSRGRQHLLKLQPQTGRTHQLRVHLSYLGLPILGDYLYGGEAFSRLMLHAAAINFTDPDGQVINVETTLPPEFKPWIN